MLLISYRVDQISVVGTLAVDPTQADEEIDESVSVKEMSQTAPPKGDMNSVINELFHKVISSLTKFDDKYLASEPCERLAPELEHLRKVDLLHSARAACR